MPTIGIADKITLDTVNSKVTTINTNVNTANTDINTIKTDTATLKNNDSSIITKSDAIINDTTSIITKAEAIKNDTASILAKVNSSSNGGIDWSSCVPFYIRCTANLFEPTKVVCNITGKGFVTKIIQSAGTGVFGYDNTLKVTIDGIVVINYNGSNSTVKGFSQLCQSTVSIDTNYFTPIPIFPSENLQTDKLLTYPVPLFFKSSLKVETLRDSVNNNVGIFCEVIGGIL